MQTHDLFCCYLLHDYRGSRKNLQVLYVIMLILPEYRRKKNICSVQKLCSYVWSHMYCGTWMVFMPSHMECVKALCLSIVRLSGCPYSRPEQEFKISLLVMHKINPSLAWKYLGGWGLFLYAGSLTSLSMHHFLLIRSHINTGTYMFSIGLKSRRRSDTKCVRRSLYRT